jgi:hypothetical protein
MMPWRRPSDPRQRPAPEILIEREQGAPPVFCLDPDRLRRLAALVEERMRRLSAREYFLLVGRYRVGESIRRLADHCQKDPRCVREDLATAAAKVRRMLLAPELDRPAWLGDGRTSGLATVRAAAERHEAEWRAARRAEVRELQEAGLV